VLHVLAPVGTRSSRWALLPWHKVEKMRVEQWWRCSSGELGLLGVGAVGPWAVSGVAEEATQVHLHVHAAEAAMDVGCVRASLVWLVTPGTCEVHLHGASHEAAMSAIVCMTSESGMPPLEPVWASACAVACGLASLNAASPATPTLTPIRRLGW
jgi:hypothetical protein